MIYVTVGTTHFDPLIQVVDQLAKATGKEYLCQIGSGRYQPTHAAFFRYDPDHWKHAHRAEYVITHGGTGSVLYLVRHRIPFVAVANKALQDDHQTEFLSALARRCNLVWTDRLEELPGLVKTPPPSLRIETQPLGSTLLSWLKARRGTGWPPSGQGD